MPKNGFKKIRILFYPSSKNVLSFKKNVIKDKGSLNISPKMKRKREGGWANADIADKRGRGGWGNADNG